MSYYFKSGNKIFSDTVAGASKIKHLYRYKTILDPKDTNGQGYGHQWFYVKDGTRPWFDPVCSDGDYHSDREIDKLTYNYMPVLQFAISSISGKYNFSDGCGSYYIPYNTTPMLCDKEIIKYNGNTETFEPLITNVDYSKGGKIYWRMSESNLNFFNNGVRGPTRTNYKYVNEEDDGYGNTIVVSGSNLCYDNGNTDFYNVNFSPAYFIYPNSTATTPLTNYEARFIKSKPYCVENLNKFGFTLHDSSLFTSYTPPHFTLDISQIKAAGYNKLKIKMDGLYLYGNNNFAQYYTNVVFNDTSFVNNAASFSSDLNVAGTNPYCQALVYAITDNATWNIPDITPGVDYLNNGTIFSNLTKATTFTTDTPVVSSRNDYTIKHFTYNDFTVKEEQSLDNMNVWKHMYLKFVQDNKIYKDVQEEIGPCPDAATATIGGYCTEDCPVCSRLREDVYYEDVNAQGGVNTRYIFCKEYVFASGDNYLIDKCKNYLTAEKHDIGELNSGTYPIAKHYGNIKYSINNCGTDIDVYGIKVPIFTGSRDEEPYGYYIAANYEVDNKNKFQCIKTVSGACCDGTGETYKMSGTDDPNHWITHHAGDGWLEGEREYIPYFRKTTTYENRPIKQFREGYKIPCLFCNSGMAAYKLPCYCCQDKDDSNYKLQYGVNNYERGKIKHRSCFGTKTVGGKEVLDETKPGGGHILPYKHNTVYYRFKFYGKNIAQGKKEFDGFITSGDLSLVSSVNKSGGGTTQYAYKQVNWEDWESQKDTGPSGAYAYRDSVPGDYVDYRSIFFNDQEKEGDVFLGEIPEEKWSSLSSQWMVYSYDGNKNYTYYYGHSDSNKPSRDGIKGNTTFDLVWKGTATDYYGNDTPSTAQAFKPNGMTPSAGCNYTYSNVILENTIDLTNKTGYLHICYPYVTVYGDATNVNKNCGIIPQMIMTYEGTN